LASKTHSFLIPDSEIPRLKKLASIEAGKLQLLTGKLSAQPLTLERDNLSTWIAEEAGLDLALVQMVVPVLCRLAVVRRATDQSAEDLVRSVGAQLRTKGDPVWSEADASAWDEMVTNIATLIAPDSPVDFAAKALELRWEHEKVYCEARILTNARPIFDDKAGSVRAYVPFHILSIRYHESGKTVETAFAISSQQMKELQAQIERAVKKEHTLVEHLKTTGVPILDLGGDTNG
jgi:hypothetical protein